MNVAEAVTKAKKYVIDIFADEEIKNLGLEEIEFDESSKEWRVTLGFSRPWDESRNALASLTQASGPRRSYKIVRISDNSSDVISIKTHEVKS